MATKRTTYSALPGEDSRAYRSVRVRPVSRVNRLDEAMRQFARAYADQIEADHQALVRAVARGRLPGPRRAR